MSHAAVGIQEAPLEFTTVMPELVPQYAVEIRDVNERTLVPMREELPAAPYFVFLSRYAKRPLTQPTPG